MTTANGRRVRMSDVAALAKVDQAVVSKVINGSTTLNIRPETRERVWKAINQLGYRPNEVARSLRTARAGMFGLLIPDFTNPVYASIIRGAELAAKQHEQLVLTASIESRADVGHYVRALSGGRIDGVLLAGGPATTEVQQQIDSLRLPFVLLNRKGPSSSRYIVLDDERATALAVNHLAELGHSQIAHIAGPRDADTAVRRRAGFQAAMAAIAAARLGVDPQSPWRLKVPRSHIAEADYTSEGGLAAMQKLLAAKVRPTAIVAANIASAIGALRAARLADLRIPADLSIVAIHDLPLANYTDPPLTTVLMPTQQLGYRGIEVLVTVPADQNVTEVLHEPMQLVMRESTAPPR